MSFQQNQIQCQQHCCAVDNEIIKKHVHESYATTTFQCPCCSFQTAHKSELQKHVANAHIHLKSFDCDKCEQSFERSSQLKKHVVVAHKKSSSSAFRCSIDSCRESFAFKHHFKQHIRSHECQTNLCDVCGKAFATTTLLAAHRKQAHAISRPFKCGINDCGEAFRNKSKLVAHKQQHGIEPPSDHHCSICVKSFSSETKLKQHMSAHHFEPKKCKCCCPDCGAVIRKPKSKKK